MNNTNYRILTSEIVKSIRAHLSQGQFNKRLGFQSNQAHRWERGTSRLSWTDFLNLCVKFNIDLSEILFKYFRFDRDLHIPSNLLEHLFAGRDQDSISRITGLTKGKIKRILEGYSNLYFDDFLNILFSLNEMEALCFVFEITKNNSIPSLDSMNNERKKFSTFYGRYPEFGVLLVCVNFLKYQNQELDHLNYLSNLTGVDAPRITAIMKEAELLGLIDASKGHFRPAVEKHQMSDRGQQEAMINIRKYWSEQAVKKQKVARKDDIFITTVFSVSQDKYSQIISSYLKFAEEFKEIVTNDIDDETAIPLVMNFHMFNPGQ